MQYKIISLDIFQTLVDVNKRIPQIWKAVLNSDYSDDKAYLGAKTLFKYYPSVYQKAVISNQFINMEDIFLECSKKALDEIAFSTTPEIIVNHLMQEHSYAPFYDEVLPYLNDISKKYPIVLSSDSNHTMVDNIIKKVPCKKAFISEDLCCYKEDSRGRFFNRVLDRLRINPSEIIHIGDSAADVIGANRAGIVTCWLNRRGRSWNNSIQPDYIINNLKDLSDIL